MVRAYCVVCRSWTDANEMVHTFRTGFVRVGGMDHPLGICNRPDARHRLFVTPGAEVDAGGRKDRMPERAQSAGADRRAAERMDADDSGPVASAALTQV
ncbi:hypothetical protein [Alicyclobacillus sp.]|uniref:hypothetical protein n=1 Tax=Alicyclobacillus sp. TaxID=61169 RepID=UPI0025C707DA|nr:hypothetical protein [Alicyclobacillus sp.]MCL6516939.1 hypothetical protein [Alicyclobacillus sp.]